MKSLHRLVKFLPRGIRGNNLAKRGKNWHFEKTLNHYPVFVKLLPRTRGNNLTSLDGVIILKV